MRELIVLQLNSGIFFPIYKYSLLQHVHMKMRLLTAIIFQCNFDFVVYAPGITRVDIGELFQHSAVTINFRDSLLETM